MEMQMPETSSNEGNKNTEETNENADECVSHLHVTGFQEDNSKHGAVTTAFHLLQTEAIKANDPSNNNVPVPNVMSIATPSCSSTIEPGSVLNGEMIDGQIFRKRNTEQLLKNKEEVLETGTPPDRNLTNSMTGTSQRTSEDTSSVLMHVGTGENIHIMDNLNDLTVEDIAVNDEEFDECSAESDILNINDLPQELLNKILSYITQYDLCHSVACICRLWKDLAYDPVHWQKLDFKNKNVTPGTLIHCINRATRLKQLKWHDDLTLEEIVHIENHCKLLVELDLGFCDNLNTVMVSRIVEGCPRIETLNLEGCRLIDHECIELLCGLCKLTNLNLSHCQHVQDESVSILAKRLPALTKFNIDGIAHISDGAIMDLVDHQKEHLEILELDGLELTDASMEKISTCPRLKKLSVSFAELLTGKSLRFIRTMESLRSLRLKKGADFCGGALHHMFEVGKLNNLTSLNLTECINVDDDVIKAMVKCCGANLKSLVLCWCWNITDAGLYQIVCNCKRMEFLDLLGLDKICGDILREVPERMPQLVYLNLQQCNLIQDHVVESMVREKRDLVAFNYYGEEFSALNGEFA